MASASPSGETFDIDHPSTPSLYRQLRPVLLPLASLKLTVVLFALSIVLIMVGTLAQVEADIWDVVREYFRCWVFWMPVRVWHPLFAPYVDVSGEFWDRIGIWFPGGFLIGTLMAANLLSAHGLKFNIQAKGTRLAAGLVTLVIGILSTWLVLESGHSDASVQDASISWDSLWTALQALSATLLLMNIWGVVEAFRSKKAQAPVLVGTAAALTGATIYLCFKSDGRFDDSSMRILWQLVKGELAALVLLAGCVMLFKKRCGVVLLHGGIALVMINEIVVTTTHVEQQMTIEEGKAGNYGQDIREYELVLTDRSDEEYDDEIVISRDLIQQSLKAGGSANRVISDDDLPFDVEIVRFLQNSNPQNRTQLRFDIAAELEVPPVQTNDASKIATLQPDAEKVNKVFDNLELEFQTKFTPKLRTELATLGEVIDHVFAQNPATMGAGINLIAAETRPGAGTDTGGVVDVTSCYVRLIDKESKKEVGTLLTNVFFQLLMKPEYQTNKVEHNGTTWDVELRFRRYYKQYSVHLFDVSKTDYVGTNTPRDYRSQVRVIDPTDNIDFERDIWMNNPLRYAGETFYQTNYHAANPSTGEEEKTTLSVVSNTGWMIPYVACMIVGTGMMAHFWIVLLRFLGRRPRLAGATGEYGIVGRVIPWVVMLLIAGWLGGKAFVPSTADDAPDLYQFGKLPLVYEGRVKPFDTLARNSLRILSNREVFTDRNGEKQPAVLWLLDVISGSDRAREHRVFRADHPELLKRLDLPRRKKHLYSLDELLKNVSNVAQDVEKARRKDGKERTAFERKLIELESKVGLYDLLFSSFAAIEIEPSQIQQIISRLQSLDRRQPPLAVPPDPKVEAEADEAKEEAGGVNAEWQTFSRGFVTLSVSRMFGQDEHPPVRLMVEILEAHESEDAETFNSKVAEYHSWLRDNTPKDLNVAKCGFETYFNEFAPFYYSAFSYLFAFVFGVAALLGWSRPLNRTAFLIIAVTLLLHTFALGARIYISGRPPVTNLYSSAVFIGWGCVVLGMIYESIYRIGLGNIIGSAMGAITLGISFLLSGDGDTFKVLQAVLDTQFWLATHVVCITLGYSTTFLAGAIGILYILLDSLRPAFRMVGPRAVVRNTAFLDAMPRMIYGTICFGIFFSFVGTVLGGLWADDSWGRFWGWDPKENGALMIVVWNALLLHARWDKLVRDRGLAVLALGGNMVTAWSWFGVNELSVGLHAYGFTEGVWFALWLFWLSQLALIGLGVMPSRWFRSPADDPTSIPVAKQV
jgi:ABC-type transport system involved in cytochrome c biogenesis permease subunit